MNPGVNYVFIMVDIISSKIDAHDIMLVHATHWYASILSLLLDLGVFFLSDWLPLAVSYWFITRSADVYVTL
jgi:hypothetical protein